MRLICFGGACRGVLLKVGGLCLGGWFFAICLCIPVGRIGGLGPLFPMFRIICALCCSIDTTFLGWPIFIWTALLTIILGFT
jgi:hypothetical protein